MTSNVILTAICALVTGGVIGLGIGYCIGREDGFREGVETGRKVRKAMQEVA